MGRTRKVRPTAVESALALQLIPRKEQQQNSPKNPAQNNTKGNATVETAVTTKTATPLSTVQSQVPGSYVEFLNKDGKSRLAASSAEFYITGAEFNPDGEFGMQWTLTIVFPQFERVYRLSFAVDEGKMNSDAATSRDALMRGIAEETAIHPVGPCVLKSAQTASGNTWYYLDSPGSAQLPF